MSMTLNLGAASAFSDPLMVITNPRISLTAGTTGSFVTSNTETNTNTNQNNNQTTISSTATFICPNFPGSYTCTWSGVWGVSNSIPLAQQQYNNTMYYQLIGGGVVVGFINGLITASVSQKTTNVYLQCYINGTWVPLGDQLTSQIASTS